MLRHHRIIWALTGAVAVSAGLVLAVRRTGEEHPASSASNGRAGVTPVERVGAMLQLLETDPSAEQEPAKRAVEAVAALAETGQLDTAEGYFALGLRCYGQRAFEPAEAAYRKAIALRPDWSWVHHGLGVLLGRFTVDRWPEAEAELRKAVELDPEWSRPHDHLAILLRRQGRLDDARREAETALRLEPGDVAVHNNYGNLLLAQGRMDEAEQEYRKAIELDSDHPKPYYNLGCLHCLKGQPQEAIAYLADAIQRAPVLREDAKIDPDFAALRADPAFQRLVNDQ